MSVAVGDHDLYVMMEGSTIGPGASSRGPIIVTFDDINHGQVRYGNMGRVARQTFWELSSFGFEIWRHDT